MSNGHVSVLIHAEKVMLMPWLLPDMYRLDGGKPCNALLGLYLCYAVVP
jgi:hypothetical protein